MFANAVQVQKGFAVKGGNSLENRARAVAELLLPRLSDHLAVRRGSVGEKGEETQSWEEGTQDDGGVRV